MKPVIPAAIGSAFLGGFVFREIWDFVGKTGLKAKPVCSNCGRWWSSHGAVTGGCPDRTTVYKTTREPEVEAGI